MSFNTTTMEQSDGTPRSGEKASSPGPVRRTWEKMRQPRCIAEQGMLHDAAGGPESPSSNIAHVTTFEHVGAVAAAMVKELASFLKREEGDEALRNVFVGQAEIIVNMSKRLLVSDEVGQASRLAGEELVLGTSDGLEKRLRAVGRISPRPSLFSSCPSAPFTRASFWLDCSSLCGGLPSLVYNEPAIAAML